MLRLIIRTRRSTSTRNNETAEIKGGGNVLPCSSSSSSSSRILELAAHAAVDVSHPGHVTKHLQPSALYIRTRRLLIASKIPTVWVNSTIVSVMISIWMLMLVGESASKNFLYIRCGWRNCAVDVYADGHSAIHAVTARNICTRSFTISERSQFDVGLNGKPREVSRVHC